MSSLLSNDIIASDNSSTSLPRSLSLCIAQSPFFLTVPYFIRLFQAWICWYKINPCFAWCETNWFTVFHRYNLPIIICPFYGLNVSFLKQISIAPRININGTPSLLFNHFMRCLNNKYIVNFDREL